MIRNMRYKRLVSGVICMSLLFGNVGMTTSDLAKVYADEPENQELLDTTEENTEEEILPEENEETSAEDDLILEEVELSEEFEEEPEEAEVTEALFPEKEGKINWNPAKTKSVSLDYDDRISLAELGYEGYQVVENETEMVTSYQVRKGAVTDQPDETVITVDAENYTDLYATGTGMTSLYLVPDSMADTVRGAEDGGLTSQQINRINREMVEVDVVVSPANLSVFYLAGQSNMEGSWATTGLDGFKGAHPENSILCPEGEVYSTYIPSSAARAKGITGVELPECNTASGVNAFIAESLTSDQSLTGKELKYKLNGMTAAGRGKMGPDSAIAYEWNQLTDDKVWTVNAAFSATLITEWVPGETAYERALATFESAKKVAEAEEEAGHYVISTTAVFWQHGETDNKKLALTYKKQFDKLYKGFEAALSPDYWAMISVRAHLGDDRTTNELVMDGPRAFQYWAGTRTGYGNLHLVSNANENWVSDEGVKAYFGENYPKGLDYPMRSNTKIPAGTQPSLIDQIHGDIHYTQLGHNENGLTAARGLFNLLWNDKAGDGTFAWYDNAGKVLSGSKTIYAVVGQDVVVCPKGTYVWEGKSLRPQTDIKYDSSAFDCIAGVLIPKTAGTYTVTAKDLNLKIVVADKLETPKITKVANNEKNIKITWDSVAHAEYYRLYRKVSGGSWAELTTTAGTSYVDENVTEGTVYYYTVRTVTLTGFATSDYNSAGTAQKRMLMPVFSLSNTSSGVKVKWDKVKGATGYYIYRKIGADSSYARVGTVTSGDTLTFTAESGKKYIYTVRANAGSYLSPYKNAGAEIIRLPQVKLTSVANTKSGVQVKWDQTDSATGYYLYRKDPGGSWTRIATFDTNTTVSYTDTNVSNGKTYIYTIKNYKDKYVGSYSSAGKTIARLSTSAINAIELSKSRTIKLTWSKNSSAGGYQVQYSTSSSFSSPKVKKITSGLTGTTTIGSLTKGKTYYCRVRSYKVVNDVTYYSGWSEAKSLKVSK